MISSAPANPLSSKQRLYHYLDDVVFVLAMILLFVPSPLNMKLLSDKQYAPPSPIFLAGSITAIISVTFFLAFATAHLALFPRTVEPFAFTWCSPPVPYASPSPGWASCGATALLGKGVLMLWNMLLRARGMESRVVDTGFRKCLLSTIRRVVGTADVGEAGGGRGRRLTRILTVGLEHCDYTGSRKRTVAVLSDKLAVRNDHFSASGSDRGRTDPPARTAAVRRPVCTTRIVLDEGFDGLYMTGKYACPTYFPVSIYVFPPGVGQPDLGDMLAKASTIAGPTPSARDRRRGHGLRRRGDLRAGVAGFRIACCH
ncbi:hypothetical protein B0H10DRAFT_1947775 [Mycena sp. CBHHK59/15]|nr:hypothetical protein B0H10DRAFT_1947775 [Mycena sp. CBHHK59/15]